MLYPFFQHQGPLPRKGVQEVGEERRRLWRSKRKKEWLGRLREENEGRRVDKKERRRAEEERCSGHRASEGSWWDLGDLPVNEVRFGGHLLHCSFGYGWLHKEGESPSPLIWGGTWAHLKPFFSCRGGHCSPVSFLPAGPIPSMTGP